LPFIFGSCEKVADQGLRIRDSKAVVMPPSSSIQIPSELGLVHLGILPEAGYEPKRRVH